MAASTKTSKANTKAPGKSAGKRMTQSEVMNHFAQKFELKRAEVKEFFDELTELASKEVKKNGEFTLPGFGKVVLAKRKAREGRNPATGETIQIAAKTTLKFRVGKAMKDGVIPAKKK
jgi:DNA-binding protein HU-beta